MQVEFFDLPFSPDPQKVELLWPSRFVAQKLRTDMLRIYFVTFPRATVQVGTFHLITSDQVLPETFPGQYMATVYSDDADVEDDAFHLFFETPVNAPKRKPRVLGNEGADNGTD